MKNYTIEQNGLLYFGTNWARIKMVYYKQIYFNMEVLLA